MTIEIYLAHRNSTKLIKQQVTLIKKFFTCDLIEMGEKEWNDCFTIFGYVDGSTDSIKYEMKLAWESVDAIPINIPNICVSKLDGNTYDRNTSTISVSYGLAFQYVYDNYILKTSNTCICLENDVFPFKKINIDEFVKGHEIVGEIRFNVADFPDRMVMFWLGIIMFNNSIMTDREQWNGQSYPVVCKESGKTHGIDCGGQSYYWITSKKRDIKQIKSVPEYDGFTSNICIVHNITTDVEKLPPILRDGYHPSFRCIVYDDIFIHLEQIGQKFNNDKINWWNNCYNKLIEL